MKKTLKDLSVILKGRVDSKIAKERWDICKMCEFITYNNRCNKCGCFMKAKTRFKQAVCPENKW